MFCFCLQGKFAEKMSSIVLPSKCPSATEDCEEIRKALKGGRSVNEDSLIKIFANRDSNKLKAIRENYQHLYKDDLVKLLESKLHGKFENALVLWILDKGEKDAVIMHRAMKSWSKDYNALTEVVCTRTTQEIAEMAHAYRLKYGKELEDDIASETSGMITKVLLALIYSSRSSMFYVNMDLAKADAKALHQAGRGGALSQDKIIARTFSERSKEHLQATFECYKQIFGQDLKKALKKRTGEAFENELRGVIKCIQSPAQYFAKALHIAMKGLGTDDDVLARILVTRAEIDMVEIKHIYQKKYKDHLEKKIAKETVGDFRAFLLALVKT